jgi:hypothetical protein
MEAEALPFKWESAPTRFVRAQEVVRLRPVSSPADLPLGAAPGFTPAFLHQYFDGEALALPATDRPLRIEVLYGASSLKLHIRCDRPMQGAVEDAMYALAGQLPCVESEASAVLTGGPASAADLSAYGELVSEYIAPEATVGAPTTSAAGGGPVGGGDVVACRSQCEVRCGSLVSFPTLSSLNDRLQSPRGAAGGEGGEAVRSHCEVRCGSLSSSPLLSSLNDRLQALMRFEIDAHSPIDTAKERWRVFTVWDKGPPPSKKRKAAGAVPAGEADTSAAADAYACSDAPELDAAASATYVAPSGKIVPQLAAAATVFLFQRWVQGQPRLVLKVSAAPPLPFPHPPAAQSLLSHARQGQRLTPCTLSHGH